MRCTKIFGHIIGCLICFHLVPKNFNWEKLWSLAFPEGVIQITLTKRLGTLYFHFRIIVCTLVYVCMACTHTDAPVDRYIGLCTFSSLNASVSVFC